MMRKIGLGLILIVAAGAFTAAQAQQTLRLGHVYETNHPMHIGAQVMADLIEEGTDDRYQVELFPASQLGNEVQINEQLAFGGIDMIFTGALFAGKEYKPLQLSGLPYVFRDLDHVFAYLNSDLFDSFRAGYHDKTSNYILAGGYYGVRHVTANKPVRKPADMEGLKIRVPNSPMYLLFPQAVGANPTPIAFSEVYLALQQGTVDAQENPLPTIDAKKFYEVQDYISLTGHIHEVILMLVNGMLYDGLSEMDRKVFQLAAEAGMKTASRIVMEREDSLKRKLDEHVDFVEADRTTFRQVVTKAHDDPRFEGYWSEEQYQRLLDLGTNSR